MSTIDASEERALVEELSRAALADALPEELGVFEARRDDFLEARGSIPPQEAGPDEPAGFGAEVVVLLTPYVVAGALAAVRFLGGLLADTVKDEAKPHLAKVVRRLFRLEEPSTTSTSEQDALAALPPDTVTRVREVVRTACRQHGLDDDDAALVSDAVAGRLVLPES